MNFDTQLCYLIATKCAVDCYTALLGALTRCNIEHRQTTDKVHYKTEVTLQTISHIVQSGDLACVCILKKHVEACWTVFHQYKIFVGNALALGRKPIANVLDCPLFLQYAHHKIPLGIGKINTDKKAVFVLVDEWVIWWKLHKHLDNFLLDGLVVVGTATACVKTLKCVAVLLHHLVPLAGSFLQSINIQSEIWVEVACG